MRQAVRADSNPRMEDATNPAGTVCNFLYSGSLHFNPWRMVQSRVSGMLLLEPCARRRV